MTPFGDDPDTNLLLIRARWERTLEEMALGRGKPAAEKDEHLGRRSRLSRLVQAAVTHVAARVPRSTVPAHPAEPDSIVVIRPLPVRLETCDGAYHTGECVGCK